MKTVFRLCLSILLLMTVIGAYPQSGNSSAAHSSAIRNIIAFFSAPVEYSRTPVYMDRKTFEDRILGHTWESQREAGRSRFEKETDSTYLARIIWVPDSHFTDGKPPLDFRNPEKSKRLNPIIGLVYSSGIKYIDGKWIAPYLYHPNFGITAGKGVIFFNIEGDLIVRGTKWGFSATECYKIVDFTPDI